MRRKEVVFVFVFAVSAFLIVTANTVSDDEFNEDDVEQEMPATESEQIKPSDKEWIDADGKQEIPTTELLKKKPYDKEWIDDDREQEISTTELPKREPSDEEFVNVNGKQEITTTELPKRKPKLSKIAGDSLPCPSPPDIKDAILPPSDGNEYFEGERVAYRCDYGYVSRNSLNHLSTCILNKTTGRTEWTVPEIACIPRSCGDPGRVINGRRKGNLFTFPNSVEFECEDGYELVGMKARYCQAGGEWSGKLPQCEPIICSIPSDPVNGEVVFSSVEYGAEIHYRCFRGYMRSHTEPRYCEKDGSWSGGAPECIEVKCGEPKPPENGEVHFIGVPKVGSIATYSCNPGLKLYGASRTKCLITGEWTFGPPKCLGACSVPHVENGEMLKLTVRQITRSRQEETYTRVSEGQQIEHDTTLKFQCNDDFVIFEGYNLIEDVRTDVTCYEGNWSRDLHCKPMSCQEDPPRTEYGKAIAHRRNHGYTIWYRCDDPRDKKIPGNVTCHYGRWIGTPPQCLSLIPCYSKDLDFPGLVKPSQNRVASSESFAIACKQGYMLSTAAKTMTCKRGKWNVTEDPCPEEYKDPEQSTSRPVTVPPLQMRRSTPPSVQPDLNIQPPEQCDCTYVGAGHHVQATVGLRKLRDGDKVRKGEAVIFSCKGAGRMLTWGNGFRTYGNASVTCNTCRRWEVTDNPDCKVLEGGGPFIVLEDSLEIKPGGAVEVLIKKPITLRCVSSFYYPLWRFRGQPVHVVGCKYNLCALRHINAFENCSSVKKSPEMEESFKYHFQFQISLQWYNS